MKFQPPAESRSNEELKGIANSTTEYWQQEIIIQSREELDRRGVSKAEESTLLAKWVEEDRQYEAEYAKWLKQNATKEYRVHEKLFILLLAPLILIGTWQYGVSLSRLKADNYILKYRQRWLLLLSGTRLWIAALHIIAWFAWSVRSDRYYAPGFPWKCHLWRYFWLNNDRNFSIERTLFLFLWSILWQFEQTGTKSVL